MGKIECQLRRLIKQKELDENRNITYTEISASSGLTLSAISKLVNNETSRYYISTLIALCEYFNCQVGDLLVYIPDEPEEEHQS